MSYVTCQMSCVTSPIFIFFLDKESGKAYQLRVCYRYYYQLIQPFFTFRLQYTFYTYTYYEDEDEYNNNDNNNNDNNNDNQKNLNIFQLVNSHHVIFFCSASTRHKVWWAASWWLLLPSVKLSRPSRSQDNLKRKDSGQLLS